MARTERAHEPENDQEARSHLTKDETKAVMKEAIQEWLDAQFAQFGRLSMRAILSLAFAALLYAYLATHGFKLP